MSDITELNNKILLLPVTSDFIFKLIFGDQRNVDILADFLKSVLNIPDEEYDTITIIDPYVKKEATDDKYSVLDVKLHTKSKNIIHIEIQLWPLPELKERSIYQQSKMITEQMSSGENWKTIKRVVSIIITNHDLIKEDDDYHHQFRYRTKYGVEFTDLKEINTLELSKLPETTENTDLWYWMKFIKSNDGEVLDMIAERKPQMKKAVGFLKELSADERTRMLYEEREKARRDWVSLMGGARNEGRNEGRMGERMDIARNLINMNMPMDTIIKATGLTQEEIESL
ncbi:MAG: Rpn family recombination-promoting nuclease/putative transposase [Defluviitaleaceae bacterium]|nr:Rpn family recombination-promoting nuclease/putative transposase [Defluviitaleaceae bacterium]